MSKTDTNPTLLGHPLCHREEHLSCYNFSNGEQAPISILELRQGQVYLKTLDSNEIVYIYKGKVEIDSHFRLKVFEASENRIFALPVKTKVDAKALTDCQIIIMRLDRTYRICEQMHFERLHSLPVAEHEESILIAAKPISHFFDTLVETMQAGILCRNYLNSKVDEFLMLLRHLYNKEDIAGMLRPILSGDMEFWSIIMNNYDKARSVNDLCEIASMPRRQFHRKWNEVFSVTPKEFLNEAKGETARYELMSNNKSISEIAFQLGFPHEEGFSRFFTQRHEITPREFRKQNQIMVSEP